MKNKNCPKRRIHGMSRMKDNKRQSSMLSKKEINEKIKKAVHSKPLVRVGKNGVKKGLLEDIKRHVEKNKIVKVKVLQSVDDYKGILNEISTRTGLTLAKKIGRTGIYYNKSMLRYE